MKFLYNLFAFFVNPDFPQGFLLQGRYCIHAVHAGHELSLYSKSSSTTNPPVHTGRVLYAQHSIYIIENLLGSGWICIYFRKTKYFSVFHIRFSSIS